MEVLEYRGAHVHIYAHKNTATNILEPLYACESEEVIWLCSLFSGENYVRRIYYDFWTTDEVAPICSNLIL